MANQESAEAEPYLGTADDPTRGVTSPQTASSALGRAHVGADGRDAAGRFRRGNTTGPRFEPGNRAAERHGAVTAQRRGELPDDVQREMQALVQRYQADPLDAVRHVLATQLVWAQTICQLYVKEIASRGPTTPSGKTRASVLQAGSWSDRVTRITAQIREARKES